jgi:hypothetical protein
MRPELPPLAEPNSTGPLLPEVGPVKIKTFLLSTLCGALGAAFLGLGVGTAVVTLRILRRATTIHMGIFLVALIILVACSLGAVFLRYSWAILAKRSR